MKPFGLLVLLFICSSGWCYLVHAQQQVPSTHNNNNTDNNNKNKTAVHHPLYDIEGYDTNELSEALIALSFFSLTPNAAAIGFKARALRELLNCPVASATTFSSSSSSSSSSSISSLLTKMNGADGNYARSISNLLALDFALGNKKDPDNQVYSTYYGSILGTFVLLIVLLLVHYISVHSFSRQAHLSFEETTQRLRFPFGLLHVAIICFGTTSVYSATVILSSSGTGFASSVVAAETDSTFRITTTTTTTTTTSPPTSSGDSDSDSPATLFPRLSFLIRIVVILFGLLPFVVYLFLVIKHSAEARREDECDDVVLKQFLIVPASSSSSSSSVVSRSSSFSSSPSSSSKKNKEKRNKRKKKSNTKKKKDEETSQEEERMEYQQDDVKEENEGKEDIKLDEREKSTKIFQQELGATGSAVDMFFFHLKHPWKMWKGSAHVARFGSCFDSFGNSFFLNQFSAFDLLVLFSTVAASAWRFGCNGKNAKNTNHNINLQEQLELEKQCCESISLFTTVTSVAYAAALLRTVVYRQKRKLMCFNALDTFVFYVSSSILAAMSVLVVLTIQRAPSNFRWSSSSTSSAASTSSSSPSSATSTTSLPASSAGMNEQKEEITIASFVSAIRALELVCFILGILLTVVNILCFVQEMKVNAVQFARTLTSASSSSSSSHHDGNNNKKHSLLTSFSVTRNLFHDQREAKNEELLAKEAKRLQVGSTSSKQEQAGEEGKEEKAEGQELEDPLLNFEREGSSKSHHQHQDVEKEEEEEEEEMQPRKKKIRVLSSSSSPSSSRLHSPRNATAAATGGSSTAPSPSPKKVIRGSEIRKREQEKRLQKQRQKELELLEEKKKKNLKGLFGGEGKDDDEDDDDDDLLFAKVPSELQVASIETFEEETRIEVNPAPEDKKREQEENQNENEEEQKSKKEQVKKEEGEEQEQEEEEGDLFERPDYERLGL